MEKDVWYIWQEGYTSIRFKMCIRDRAGREQLPEIMEIYSRARKFMTENGNPGQWKGGYPSQELVEQDMNRGELYVCLEKDQIARCV